MKKHSVDYRVYYEDTDAGGIVYYARYLQFAERGRTELLRELGYENQSLREKSNIGFVVGNVNIAYKKTAKLDDIVTVETTVKEVKNSSLIMHQKIMRDNHVITDMSVVLVCVDNIYFKPVRMPEEIKKAFMSYLETKEQ